MGLRGLVLAWDDGVTTFLLSACLDAGSLGSRPGFWAFWSSQLGI